MLTGKLQRFYQRALSGNTALIIQDARSYMRRATFAKYCDRVLLPGLALAGSDLRLGHIDEQQSERIKKVIVRVTEELAGTRPNRRAARRRRATVPLAAANVGAHLRQMREANLGPWQGELDVPPQSIVLCFGFGTERDDLLTELLVRALRQDAIDARSASLSDPQDPARADKSILVGTAFLTYPAEGALTQWRAVAAEMRAALPDALIATIRLPLDEAAAPEETVQGDVNLILHSYAEAEAFVLQARKPA